MDILKKESSQTSAFFCYVYIIIYNTYKKYTNYYFYQCDIMNRYKYASLLPHNLHYK